MTTNRFFHLAVILVWILAGAYFVDCLFNFVDNLELLGASMFLFKPSFTVDNLVRDDRRYGESDHPRLFCRLHTPAYRVFNHVVKALLKAKVYSACTVMNSRAQHKHISYKSLFSVTISHGYSAVTIGARTIFAVNEWDRTIYHINQFGMLSAVPYYQDYDMTDVITQIDECIEVLKDCYKPVPVDPIDETEWVLKEVIKDRPYHGAIKGRSVSVQATQLTHSRNLVEWKVLWERADNPSITRIESGVWPKAYKVEIEGATAWLPHSLLGEIYSSPWAYSRVKNPTATIEVPEWWYQKNVLVIRPA
tara:strand:- start:561 stop:1478 length:918 start_codon:yes stop_codon:yes gene_type:complete